MRVLLPAILILVSFDLCAQVPLSFNTAVPDHKIEAGYWQANDSTAMAVGYAPPSMRPTMLYYGFDTTENEYVSQNDVVIPAYFTTVKKNDSVYQFISIATDSRASSFFTLNYLFDTAGNLVFRPLNCNPASFDSAASFLDFVQEHVSDPGFLGAKILFVGRKEAEDLQRPVAYIGRVHKNKLSRMPEAQLLHLAKDNTTSAAQLSQLYNHGDALHVITFSMHFSSCPPCEEQVDKLYKQSRRLLGEHSPDYFTYSVVVSNTGVGEYATGRLNEVASKHDWTASLPLYLDKEFALANLFGIKSFPTTIVVNKAGDILYQRAGMKDPAATISRVVAEHAADK